MAKYFALFVPFIVKAISAQTILQPTCQPQNVYQQIQAPIASPLNLANDYSVELCKDMANAVQTMVLNRLTRNALQKPIFNQIAGPLLNEIALRVQGSSCPACGNIPIQSLINSIGNIPVQSLANSYSVGQAIGSYPVQTVRNVQGLVSSVQPLSSCSGQIQQVVNPYGQQVVQRLPATNIARQVIQNQNGISPMQLNCGCAKNVLSYY